MKKVIIVVVFALALASGMSSAVSGQIKNNPVKDDILKLAQEFADAVLENDVKAIENMTADDWVVIDADGVFKDKAQFISGIKSRTLTRSKMASKEIRVRIYDDVAVITALSTSEGKYMGKPFTSNERATDVVVRKDGRWQFIHRHLTRIVKK
jgi:ketosteroid isomerase-like protein